jgi:hypothetical protein
MRRVLLILGLIFATAVAAVLHWTLPSRDVVRILGTEVARSAAEATTQGGQVVSRSRDVRFILAATPGGAPRVYRNEDTNWGWPPYFKFDSANLAAVAETFRSDEASPRWVVVTHYGWRVPMFSMFPNAVAIRPAQGPDETLIPWFNIAFLTVLAVAGFLIRRRILSLFDR